MSIPTSLCPLIIDCCVLTPDSRCACACLKLIALWSIMNEYGCTQNIYQRHCWSWLLMLNIWPCLKAIKPTLNTTSSTSAGSWICREQRHRNTFTGGSNQNKNPARWLSRYTPVVSGDQTLLSLGNHGLPAQTSSETRETSGVFDFPSFLLTSVRDLRRLEKLTHLHLPHIFLFSAEFK